jgi:flagellin
MRIQHNIMAMNAYRNYNTNTSALSGNLEKLSSGYKINRAGDDAAGLAISEKMRAQISGLEQASSNVKDGISLVKTGEGAMQEVQDMLNRMVTLATQSANGTYDDETDRANLQKEVDALKSEINRIADSSNFNGINLLDGSLDDTVKTTGDSDLYTEKLLSVDLDGQLGNTPQAGVFELDLSDFSGVASKDSPTITVFGQKVTLADVKKDDTVTGADVAAAIAKNFGTDGTADFTKNYGVKLTAKASGSTVTFTMDKAPTKAWAQASTVALTNFTASSTGDSTNQAYTKEVKTITQPVDSSAGREYAQASIDLSKLSISDGSALTIGDSTYVFAVGTDSAYKDYNNVVKLTDITADDIANKLDLVAARITTAAQDNKNFKVTAQTPVDGSGDGTIYLTEKEGGVDTDNYKLEGKANDTDSADGDWTGLVKLGKVDTSATGSALSLQLAILPRATTS